MKTINDLLYDGESFAKYCSRKVGSCARKTELAVFEIDEERRRILEIQQQREERKRAEMEKIRDRAARKERGEEVSDIDSGNEDADSEDDFY
jgi:hypothetical protein